MDVANYVSAFKELVEVLERIVKGVAEWRHRNKTYWLDEVLEPLHSGMSKIHKTYLDTTRSFERLMEQHGPVLKIGSAGLEDALQFLVTASQASEMERDDLHGFLTALRKKDRDHCPKCINDYAWKCDSYFRSAWDQSVSTPLRGLIEKVIDANVSLGEPKHSPVTLGALDREHVGALIYNASQNIRYYTEEAWPEVLTCYHEARLELRR